MVPFIDQPFVVYGTLRAGARNQDLWDRLAVPTQGILPGYRLVVPPLSTFPVILPGDPTDEVVVDILHARSARTWLQMIAKFDRLEGHPYFYERRETKVLQVADQEWLNGWVYEPVDPYLLSGTVVPSGDWLNQDAVV